MNLEQSSSLYDDCCAENLEELWWWMVKERFIQSQWIWWKQFIASDILVSDFDILELFNYLYLFIEVISSLYIQNK